MPALLGSRDSHTHLAVQPDHAADVVRAETLAAQLGLPLLPEGEDSAGAVEFSAVLCVRGPALALQRTGPAAPGPVEVDFGAPDMRHRRRAGHNELLGKAVGVGKREQLRVIDATAGLGRDSFVLADLGCVVTMCERHPVIAEMLRAGLECARASGDEWLQAAASRMTLVPQDVRDISATQLSADLIYMDPMFPPRRKSAAVAKEMALFQLLLRGEKEDAEQLLDWASAQDVARIVVKRPSRAPQLGALKPSHCIRGKAVRYDVYVLRSLTPSRVVEKK